jgi:exodeoxyribonuclease VIII
MNTKNQLLNVMLDLETMGTSSNAPIVAIGAVFFDIKEGTTTGPTFYRIIDLESSAKYSQLDPATIKWWMKQSDDARSIFNDHNAIIFEEALMSFWNWLATHTDLKKVQIWGNGSGFDNAILNDGYQNLGHEAPWKHWNDRDVRTIVQLGRDLLNFDPKKDMQFEGEKHNALADAKHQAKYVSAIYQKLQTLTTVKGE